MNLVFGSDTHNLNTRFHFHHFYHFFTVNGRGCLQCSCSTTPLMMRRAAVSKACDACRRRKVKCSLSQPCAPCQDAGLQCTFLTIRQRKGRKGASAHVINEIRNSQQTPSLDEADSPPNPLPLHATSTIAGRLPQHSTDDDTMPTLDSFSEDLHDVAPTEQPLNSFPFPFDSLNYTSPTFSLLPDTHTSPQHDNVPTKRFARTQSLLQPRVIDVCAEFFLSELSSTVPIVTPDLIRQATAAAANDDEAYCLVCSFCAFVLLQTDELSRDQLVQAGIQQEPRVYGQTLLTEALSVRGHLDLLALPSLRTVFLTFFIYGCHSALGKHRQAWYFLREATTFYTTATMDLAEEDVDEAFHRLFWLLLVSERFAPPRTTHAWLIAGTVGHMQSADVGPSPCRLHLKARASRIWRKTVLI